MRAGRVLFAFSFGRVGLWVCQTREFGREMQYAAPVVVDSPLEERRAFGGRAFVARRPIRLEVALERLERADPRLRELPRFARFSRGERLLPQHDVARLRGHSCREIQFRAQNLTYLRGGAGFSQHGALFLNRRERGANSLLGNSRVVLQPAAAE